MNEPLPLIVERANGAFYTGDLDAAKALLRAEYGEYLRVTGLDQEDGAIGYMVGEYRGSDPTDVHAANQWGVGATEDEAWRYLAGADFGPIDDEEYDERRLRDALQNALSDLDVAEVGDIDDARRELDLRIEDLRREMDSEIEALKADLDRLSD